MQKEIDQLFIKTTNMQDKQIDDNTAMKDFVNEKIKGLKDIQLKEVRILIESNGEYIKELLERMKFLETQLLKFQLKEVNLIKPVKKSFDWRKFFKKLDR